MNLSKYKNEIKKLNPLKDSKFLYDKNKWSELNTTERELIMEFEGKYICRGDVVKAYRDYYSGKRELIRAILLTMVWGFANSGYGPYRTREYISKDNCSSIDCALKILKKGELEKAFEKLKHIKGLGISYISKILYFASRAYKLEEYALIFDRKVASSLLKLSTEKKVSDILIVSPSSKFSDYNKYLDLIHVNAKRLEVDADSIEMFLYIGQF